MDYADIIAYLNNACSESERETFEQWLSQGKANQDFFDKTKKLWEKSLSEPIEPPNVDQAWKKVSLQTVNKAPRRRILVYRIAAAIALLLLAYSANFFLSGPDQLQVIRLEQEQMQQVQLADGTQVWLNKNSRLSYPESFKGKERRVELVGEAYFDVAKNPNQPFVIEADDVEVKVLGTSFNVMAYPDSSSSRIQVESGKVAFYEKEKPDNSVYLEAGDGARFDKEVKKLELLKAQPNQSAWKTRKLIFEESPLKLVAEEIYRLYGKRVVFESEDLAKCKLTAEFNNEKIETILETLEFLFNIKAEIKSDEIMLSGSGC